MNLRLGTLLCVAGLSCSPPVVVLPDAAVEEQVVCGADNCSGCCDRFGLCVPGTELRACGSLGTSCVECPANGLCAAGSCSLIDGGSYDASFPENPDANVNYDAGTFDASVLIEPDAGRDGGVDAGVRDAGTPDAGAPDAGLPDAGARDAGTTDAGRADSGILDAGRPDSGVDAGAPDAGRVDAGALDAGRADSGVAVDAGTDGGRLDGGASDGGAMALRFRKSESIEITSLLAARQKL